MSFSRPIQWYHSHADPIWQVGIFKFSKGVQWFEPLKDWNLLTGEIGVYKIHSSHWLVQFFLHEKIRQRTSVTVP
jgi:hypothetical protein